jgi:hypothetical protein
MGDLSGSAAEKRHQIKISERARRQEGVVSRRQLHDLGLNDKQIGRREQGGDLHLIYEDVWAVGHRNISPLGHLIAAVFSCGPDCFLSHRTAAAVHGLRKIDKRAIDVTVIGGYRPRRRRLAVHCTVRTPAPTEVRTRGLLRFSSVARMFVEIAKTETDAELDRLITLAVRKRLLHIEAIEQVLERHARRPGSGRLKRALARYRPQPDRKSELERGFDAWLQQHPDIPKPVCNVHIAGWEIDCWWPEQRVALELDGRPYHIAVQDMDRDRLKDIKLQRIGIKPMRVTDFRFEHDRRGVHDDLRALLQLG